MENRTDSEEHGNSEEPKVGAKWKLEDLIRPDGIIAMDALNSQRNRSGVLQTAMSSITDNKDYRQELKTAYFTSDRKQMQMVLAIDEMRECGIDPTLVIDLLLAQKAGTKGGLLHDIFQALTHTTFSSNYTGKTGNRWWNKGESRNGGNNSSPLE